MCTRVLRSCTAELTQNHPGSSVQGTTQLRKGKAGTRPEGTGDALSAGATGETTERSCHSCRSHERFKLWGFPGSCWADSTHRTELAHIVMYRQTTFLSRACGQPLAGFAEHIPMAGRERPQSTIGAAWSQSCNRAWYKDMAVRCG